jgi:DNA-binding NarL/FixJ family response regulator
MSRVLEGCRVLVADDEPLIAMDLAEELEAAGAMVVGPVGTLDGALALLSQSEVDVALLDVMLGEQMVYPLADSLTALDIPFVFATGFVGETHPRKYADVPICPKPFALNACVEALTRALAGKHKPASRDKARQSPGKCR